MNYQKAKKFAKETGKKVRSLKMNSDEYVVYESAGFVLKANDIWNEHNKKKAIEMGGCLLVKPYFIHFTGRAIQMGLDLLPDDVINSKWMEVQ